VNVKKVLQISDLHISKQNAHLFDERWNRAGRWLKGPFDFIVVSGDIADKADASDYECALARLRKLVPLVKDGDRARIVIVPGNHDVSWADAVGEELTAKQIEDEREVLKGLLDAGPASPATYNRRFEHSFRGPTKVWAPQDVPYTQRFSAFAKFLDQFYGLELDSPHRRFDASSYDSRWHWSAHVFRKDKLAFFGLSSCLINDKHSRAGAICDNAIAEVHKHAVEHAEGLRKVAVWHHGLVSPRGRADYVSRFELKNLADKEFSLGLHGHTHHEERKYLRGAYHGDLLVLGTGSFSAAQPELEAGTYNQFSIIELDLDSDDTNWVVFEYSPREGWTPRTPIPFTNAQTQAWVVGGGGNTINWHTRTISVDEDGIATVTAKMEDLSLKEQLTIGTPSPGFTNIVWEPLCTVTASALDGQNVEITVEQEGEKPNRPVDPWRRKPYRFVASTQRPVHVQSLEWSYTFSNGFALDEVDATIGHYPGREALGLDAKRPLDGFAYCVEDRTKHLSLSFELPGKSEILYPNVVAERAFPSASEIRWEYDGDDVARASWSQPAPNRVQLEVKNPRVGSRYGMRYQLRRRKTTVKDDYLGYVNEVVDACRHETPSRAPELTAAIGVILLNALNKRLVLNRKLKLQGLKFWAAHLWDSRIKKLVVCFGEFAHEHWSSSFTSGQGIVGHAFRMCKTTVYAVGPQASNKQSLLYLPRAEGESAHQAVIELPILLDADHAVGTIGFSVRPDDGQSDEARVLFSTTANQAAFGTPEEKATARQLLDHVARSASIAFWEQIEKEHPVVGTEILPTLRGRTPNKRRV
jgi:3',5'-cyclic AMP phosphodiesterase CpdA